MNSKISIIGCGWLGLPLAKTLIKNGYDVKGSTTSKSKLEVLKVANIKPFYVNLNAIGIEGPVLEFLAESETLIINIPPGLRKNQNKNHVSEIEHLIAYIEAQQIKHVLYISSTSVYKDNFPFVTITETDAPNATSTSGKQLIAIEKLLQKNPNFKTTILRFSGLFDANRHPGKMLSGREDLKNGVAPVNLIHKKDCTAIILKILKHNAWEQTFNATYPKHPQKKAYYTNYCEQHELPPPKFSSEAKSKGKMIDSSKLAHLLNYTFSYQL